MIVGLILIAGLTLAAHWNGWRFKSFLPLIVCAGAYIAYELFHRYGMQQSYFNVSLTICSLVLLVGLVWGTVRVVRHYGISFGIAFLFVPFFGLWLILLGDGNRRKAFSGQEDWLWATWSANYPIALFMLYSLSNPNPYAFVIPLYVVAICALVWMAYNKAPKDSKISDMHMEISPGPKFPSAHVWAYILVFLLALAIILRLGSFVTHYHQFRIADALTYEQKISRSEILASDRNELIFRLLNWVNDITIFLVFLVWVYRTNKNLPIIGATNLRFTPGWAVGGFLIPLLNLVRPAQILREIRLWSDPAMEVKRSESSKPRKKRDLLVGAWWRLFVVSLLLPMIAGPTVRTVSRLEGALSGLMLRNVILCLAEALAIPAAICAIIMVERINSGQRAKFNQINQAKMSAGKT